MYKSRLIIFLLKIANGLQVHLGWKSQFFHVTIRTTLIVSSLLFQIWTVPATHWTANTLSFFLIWDI